MPAISQSVCPGCGLTLFFACASCPACGKGTAAAIHADDAKAEPPAEKAEAPAEAAVAEGKEPTEGQESHAS